MLISIRNTYNERYMAYNVYNVYIVQLRATNLKYAYKYNTYNERYMAYNVYIVQ